MRRQKRIRAVFKSRSGKDVFEGFCYELVNGEAIPSDACSALHRDMVLFGYPLRTNYGIDRVFPSDGDVFIRNLPKVFQDQSLHVVLEEEDIPQ